MRRGVASKLNLLIENSKKQSENGDANKTNVQLKSDQRRQKRERESASIQEENYNTQQTENRLKKQEAKCKPITLNDILRDHSSQPVPEHWWTPRFQYDVATDNNIDLDLMITYIDVIEVPSYTLSEEFLPFHIAKGQNDAYRAYQRNQQDISANLLSQNDRFTPPSTLVPIVRLMTEDENGCGIQVRVHGFNDFFYIPLPKKTSQKLLKSTFPQLETEDPNYQYHQGEHYTLPPTQSLDELSRIVHHRDKQLALNQDVIHYVGQIKDTLEEEIRKAPGSSSSSSFKKSKYHHHHSNENAIFIPNILSLKVVLRRSMFGYDFNEQRLFLEVLVSHSKIKYICKKIFKQGLSVNSSSFEKICIPEQEFYNSSLPMPMLYLVEQQLSGMTWITCAKGKYKIQQNLIPEEEYMNRKLKTLLGGKKYSLTSHPDQHSEDEEDEQEENDDGKRRKKKKESQSWSRVEIDIHLQDIISHFQDESPQYQKIAPYTSVAIDIECIAEEGTFPKPNRDSICCISLSKTVSNNNNFRQNLALTWKIERNVKKNKSHRLQDPNHLDLSSHNCEVIVYENEFDMMKGFDDFLRAIQPQEITGFNILKFDIPYLLDRGQVIGLDSFAFFSPYKTRVEKENRTYHSSALGEQKRTDVICLGINIFDLYRWATTELKLGANSLNAVAEHITKKSKADLPYYLIKPYFFGSKEDREALLLYNLIDSILCHDIIQDPSQCLLYRYTEIARVTGVTIDILTTKGQGVKTESQLYRLMKHEYTLCPNQPSHTSDFNFSKPSFKPISLMTGEENIYDDEQQEEESEDEKEEGKKSALPITSSSSLSQSSNVNTSAKKKKKYAGAFCIKPKVEYYSEPITTLDFASLYPSLMIAYNLSYDTFLLNPIRDLARFSNAEDIERVYVEDDVYNEEYTNSTVTQSSSSSLSSSSMPKRIFFYVKKHVRDGLLSRLVSYLLNFREQVKKQIKQAKKEKQPYELYEARSLALKIAANSTYGFVGAEKLPLPEIGECVCILGRKCLMTAINHVIKTFDTNNINPLTQKPFEYNAQVVYGDSVTGDTPILVRDRYNGMISYKRIQDLVECYHRNSWYIYKNDHTEPKMAFDSEHLDVWSEQGWTKIVRIIKHQTNKKIYQISTPSSFVKVTEDHSLLNPFAQKLPPSTCKIGSTSLLHYAYHPNKDIEDIKKNLCYSSIYKENDLIYDLDHPDYLYVLGVFFHQGNCVFNENHPLNYQILSSIWSVHNLSKKLVSKTINALQTMFENLKFLVQDIEGKDTKKKYTLTLKHNPLYAHFYFVSKFYHHFIEASTGEKKIPDQIFSLSGSNLLIFWQGYGKVYDLSEYHYNCWSNYVKKSNILLYEKFHTIVTYEIIGELATSGLYFILNQLGLRVSIVSPNPNDPNTPINSFKLMILFTNEEYQRVEQYYLTRKTLSSLYCNNTLIIDTIYLRASYVCLSPKLHWNKEKTVTSSTTDKLSQDDFFLSLKTCDHHRENDIKLQDLYNQQSIIINDLSVHTNEIEQHRQDRIFYGRDPCSSSSWVTVYDLETDNHHFQAGIGNQIVHNTDSIMVHYGNSDLKECNDLAELTEEQLKHIFRPPIRMDFEKTFVEFLLTGKKRYAGLKLEAGEFDRNVAKLDIKGMDSQKRSTILFVKQLIPLLLQKIFKFPKTDSNWRELLWKELFEFVYHRNEELAKGNLPWSQIIQTKSIKENYAIENQQTALMDNMKRRDPSRSYEAGDRIAFVYVKRMGKNNKASEQVEDPLIALENSYPIDYQRTATSLIILSEKKVLRHIIPVPDNTIYRSCRIIKDLIKMCKKRDIKPDELSYIQHDVEKLQHWLGTEDELDKIMAPFFNDYSTKITIKKGGLSQFLVDRKTCYYPGCNAFLKTNSSSSSPSNSNKYIGYQERKEEEKHQNKDVSHLPILSTTIISEKAYDILCSEHVAYYYTLIDEYQQKINNLQAQSSEIWSECRKCAGERFNPKDCANQECQREYFWLRKKVDNDIMNLQKILSTF